MNPLAWLGIAVLIAAGACLFAWVAQRLGMDP